MKQTLLALILIISINCYTQESKYSIELNFPIQVGSSFISENYSGIIDLGFRTRFIRTKHINLGFHANCSVFNFDGNVRESSFKTLYVIQPKIYTELKIIEKVKPQIAVGYSLMTYRKSGSVDNGINFNLGLNYDIAKNLFLQIQYDLITGTSEYGTRFFSFDGQLPDVLDSNNNILKFGMGYKL